MFNSQVSVPESEHRSNIQRIASTFNWCLSQWCQIGHAFFVVLGRRRARMIQAVVVIATKVCLFDVRDTFTIRNESVFEVPVRNEAAGGTGRDEGIHLRGRWGTKESCLRPKNRIVVGIYTSAGGTLNRAGWSVLVGRGTASSKAFVFLPY